MKLLTPMARTLPVVEQRLQRPVGLQGLVEGRGQRLVQDQQVDLVDAELAGALLETVQRLVVAVVADPDLRLDEDLVAGEAGGLDGLADLALVAVGGGGVDVPVAGARGPLPRRRGSRRAGSGRRRARGRASRRRCSRSACLMSVDARHPSRAGVPATSDRAVTWVLTDPPSQRDGPPTVESSGQPDRGARLPDLAPGADHARASRPAVLRHQPPRHWATPRGGRAARRRQHRLLHPPRAREPHRRVRVRARGPGAALQLDEAERTHLFDLADAANARRPPDAGAPPSSTCAPACSGSSTRSPHRPTSGTTGSTSSASTGSGVPCSPTSTPTATSRPNLARYLFLDPRSRDFYVEWARRRRGRRRSTSHRGRPQPLRPRPHRPGRRALHPQRGVPRLVGQPQRAAAPHLHQADAPPRRRRARAHRRSTRAARRRRAHHHHLHRRARSRSARRSSSSPTGPPRSPRRPPPTRSSVPRQSHWLGMRPRARLRSRF